MKIIAGSLKNKKLCFIKSKTTRPLRNFVKENIFNIIINSNIAKIDLKKTNVLDLYCGIGSFGIECISRNVISVTFVERDKEAISTLKKNLKDLSVKNNAKIYYGSVDKFINLKTKNKRFDIIFLDPPYKDNLFISNLKKIKKANIFTPNHLLIIHRESSSNEPLEEVIKIKLIKKYGRSKIIFGNF